jgi:PAS domain S-box-containing protein
MRETEYFRVSLEFNKTDRESPSEDPTISIFRQLYLQKINFFLERTLDGAFSLSPDGVILETNNYVNSVLGLARDNVLGVPLRNLLADSSRTVFDERFSTLSTSRPSTDLELEMINGKGKPTPARLNLSAEYLPNGQPLGCLAVYRDNTEMKRHLENETMQALGILAGGMAHDFNNLLTVIINNAVILREELLDHPEEQNLAGEIAFASLQAAELTKQILAFSRKQTIELKEININQLIHEIGGLLRRLIEGKIKLNVSHQCENSLTMADKNQLLQVFMNLAVNARDAMPHGGEITIQTEEVILDEDMVRAFPGLSPGNYLCVAFSDTGSGISPEIVQDIFKPFFTTKEVGRGTGLGLSVVHGIIKQHKGHISVDSSLGHGTTFRIYLPLLERASVVLKAAANKKELMGDGEKILIVEDELTVRSVTARFCAKYNYKTIAVGSVEEALQVLNCPGHDIRLVLSDISLPGRDGTALIDELELLDPSIKIILMSGYAHEHMNSLVEKNQRTELVTKPYDSSDLFFRIKRLLKKK